MRNKKIFTLVVMYLIQFLATSCQENNDLPPCGPFDSIGVAYTGFNLNPLDDSTNPIDVSTVVNIDSFGLGILADLEQFSIANNYKKSFFSSLGFQSCYACSPAGPSLSNPVTSVVIEVLDVENQEILEVTNNFFNAELDDDLAPYELLNDSLIESSLLGNETFLFFRLVNTEGIPDSSVFIMKITLQSGEEFIVETPQIDFS